MIRQAKRKPEMLQVKLERKYCVKSPVASSTVNVRTALAHFSTSFVETSEISLTQYCTFQTQLK